tara:strand:- start:296 stop:1462 length:1167 start_codon:yes stop_codon:yes gene_type:complete
LNITIVGTGYVGLSLCVLLSQQFKITALDIEETKVKQINERRSPIKDSLIEEYLSKKKLDFSATTKKEIAYKEANFIIIATPTDYEIETNNFNTQSVEEAIEDSIKYSKNATIIIKSTIPLGFTQKMRKKFNYNKIIFSPEFLRESSALYDNLYPSRIVIGDTSDEAKTFANILTTCAVKDDIPTLFMSSEEAEAVKLFSNTYLAMRISFFNELDTFCDVNNLIPKNVIDGVCLDPRIGNYYNNPSFGYGGYCLPKDTRQLLSIYDKTPNKIIKAIVEANSTRKEFVINSILKKNPKSIGIYRLTMKEGSDNFRESAVMDLINKFIEKNITILVYEPFLKENELQNIIKMESLEEFIQSSEVILANRMSKDLELVKSKVYSRDIFNEN